MHWEHDWSHAAALEHTANQTQDVVGVHWGGGLYFNYGMLLLPLDKWFGTFHDGSMEAHEEMKSRRRASAEAGDADEGAGP